MISSGQGLQGGEGKKVVQIRNSWLLWVALIEDTFGCAGITSNLQID